MGAGVHGIFSLTGEAHPDPAKNPVGGWVGGWSSGRSAALHCSWRPSLQLQREARVASSQAGVGSARSPPPLTPLLGPCLSAVPLSQYNTLIMITDKGDINLVFRKVRPPRYRLCRRPLRLRRPNAAATRQRRCHPPAPLPAAPPASAAGLRRSWPVGQTPRRGHRQQRCSAAPQPKQRRAPPRTAPAPPSPHATPRTPKREKRNEIVRSQARPQIFPWVPKEPWTAGHETAVAVGPKGLIVGGMIWCAHLELSIGRAGDGGEEQGAQGGSAWPAACTALRRHRGSSRCRSTRAA